MDKNTNTRRARPRSSRVEWRPGRAGAGAQKTVRK